MFAPFCRRFLRPRVFLPLCALLYVLLAASIAATTSPLPNEAWFFSPANNLLRNGHMGTTNLVTHGTWLEGIEERTYWVPPVYILAQALWYSIVGTGFAQMRALSIACGLLALAAMYLIGVRLRLGRFATLLAVALLVTDFRWLLTGSMGRMDMMSASLGLAGIAAYLQLRERSIASATFAAHALVTLSCLTHPCGIVHGVALAVITFCLDRQRINLRLAALAAVPYCVGLAAWGLYIFQDPGAFLRQFRGNISGLAAEAGRSTRFSGLLHPLDALVAEFRERFFNQFGNWGAGPLFGGLQMYTLGLYAAALIASLVNRRQRRTPEGLALSGAAVAVLAMFWLLDGSKTSAYLPHILPWLLLLAGFGIRRLAAGQVGLVSLLVALVLAAQAAALVGWLRKDHLHNETSVAVHYLQTHVRPGEYVIGGAEFGFFARDGLTFHDDPRLGFLTGRRPDWVLKSNWYNTWIDANRKRDPAFDRYIAGLLDKNSREVFHAGRIKIYRVGMTVPPVLH